MNQSNGNHTSVAVSDVSEDSQPQAEANSTFYDSGNPDLKAATAVATRKKSGKRKLISWSLLLLLMAGGVVALYLLLRVNRVNVKVQADTRRDAESAKPKAQTNNSENNLTAEAINIARSAAGADNVTASSTKPTASPSASPVSSPTPSANSARNLSYTGNSSPVNEIINDVGSNGKSNKEQNASGNQEPGDPSDLSGAAHPQARFNTTQCIFVGDPVPKPSIAPIKETQSKLEAKTPVARAPAIAPPVLPPFGTLLPVRTQGVIFTLRNNSYARLELTRDSSGSGWSLAKGTVFLGHTTGGEYDRAFVSVVGYIDPRDNKLVKLTGDVLGSDGGAGLPGKRMHIDRNRLKQTMRKVASSGVQVAGMMAGALGRGPIVVNGAGYRVFNPVTDEARGMIGAGDDKSTFVKVEAGRPAFVMVADLPKSIQGVDAPGESDQTRAATSLTLSLTDREVMELILFGSAEEIRAATPLMTDEQKRLAMRSLAPENDRR